MMKPKGRPVKTRKIEKEPKILVFSPRGRPGRPDEVGIGYDELEALKLADFSGLRQAQAAKRMEISRQSFGRVLRRARKLVAEGLVKGKIIRIAGGSYKVISQSKSGEGSKNK